MIVIEVTAAGFDASTDSTDGKVFWVEAPDRATVESAVQGTGAKVWDELPVEYPADFLLPGQLSELRKVLQ